MSKDKEPDHALHDDRPPEPPDKPAEEYPADDCGPCGDIAVERNHYFTGKFLSARDFRDEQQYFLSRNRLHNRTLHGWGVVCGLQVDCHPNPACRDRWVVVRAGLALDCCGRELILREDVAYELPLPPRLSKEQDGRSEELREGPFILCLRYCEQGVEMVPVLYDEKCDPNRRAPNRIRESVRLHSVDLREIGPDCWREAIPGSGCPDECEPPSPKTLGCLEPDCPCGDCVPLALIRPRKTRDYPPPPSEDREKDNEQQTGDRPSDGEHHEPEHEKSFEIDTAGRRQLPVPIELLTHVCDINWPHGGTITLRDLRRKMRGRLEVRFDAPLQKSSGDAIGVNEHTFVVQYGGVQQDLEFLPAERAPYLDRENPCLAVFEIDDKVLGRRRNIEGDVVYVTLHCDFLIDWQGQPVDGNHLGGRLPSGDGVGGGVFYSWFRVGSEPAKEERK